MAVRADPAIDVFLLLDLRDQGLEVPNEVPDPIVFGRLFEHFLLLLAVERGVLGQHVGKILNVLVEIGPHGATGQFK